MAADVYTPISGQIVAVNSELEKTPTLINEKAEETWLFEIQCDKEPDNLLSLEDYKSTLWSLTGLIHILAAYDSPTLFNSAFNIKSPFSADLFHLQTQIWKEE